MITGTNAVGFRQNLGVMLNIVQYRNDSIVIKKDGKPVAALIDARLFERIRRMQDRFDALCDRLEQDFAKVPEAEGAATIVSAVSAVRQEMKAEVATRAGSTEHRITVALPRHGEAGHQALQDRESSPAGPVVGVAGRPRHKRHLIGHGLHGGFAGPPRRHVAPWRLAGLVVAVDHEAMRAGNVSLETVLCNTAVKAPAAGTTCPAPSSAR